MNVFKSIWAHPMISTVVGGLFLAGIGYLYSQLKPPAPENELSYIADTYPIVSDTDTDMKVHINRELIKGKITGIKIGIVNTGLKAIQGATEKELYIKLKGHGVRILTAKSLLPKKFSEHISANVAPDRNSIKLSFAPPEKKEWFLDPQEWIEIRAKVEGELDKEDIVEDRERRTIPDLQVRPLFRPTFVGAKQFFSERDLDNYAWSYGVFLVIIVSTLVSLVVAMVFYLWKPPGKFFWSSILIIFIIIGGEMCYDYHSVKSYGVHSWEKRSLRIDLPKEFRDEFLR